MANIRRQNSMPPALPDQKTLQRTEHPEIADDQWVAYSRPSLDVETVYRCLEHHELYQTHIGMAIQGLPRFGGFTVYGSLTEEEELDFCKIEVRRLVAVANSDGAVILGGDSDTFGPATHEGYLHLHQVGIKLMHALKICAHDVSLLQAENGHIISGFESCSRLQSELFAEYDVTTSNERFKSSQKEGDDSQLRSYHILIDYMTAIFIKVILRNFRGDYWINNLIAAIARVAAKVKVLGNDLPKAVEVMFQEASSARIRIHRQQAWIDRHSPMTMEELGDPLGTTSSNRLPRDAGKYFLEMHTIHDLSIHILVASLSSFAIVHPFCPATNDFESSVAMYESLVTGKRVLLNEDRNGGIGSASMVGLTRTFTAGFQVCLESWEALESEYNKSESTWTSLQWKWSRMDQSDSKTLKTHQGTIKVTSMRGVIKAAVPYSFLSGGSTSSLWGLIDVVMFTSSSTVDARLYIVKQPRVVCKAIMRTNSAAPLPLNRAGTNGACHVSETYLLNRRAEAKDHDLSTKFLREPRVTGDIFIQDPERSRLRIAKAMESFGNWTVSDNAIIIPYRWYAWGWLAVSVLLVFAGLAVGFSVGNGITGVDPFNISIFCWALSGFLLVVAKAIRVENWPWSQFLRGLVPCRSVSELAAVTRVDPQVLLVILLSLDRQTYLRTYGPFNIFFSRQAEEASAGFSIDVPIRNSTALEGGIIPVKVLSEHGQGLVFAYTHSSSSSYFEVHHSGAYQGGHVVRDISQFTFRSADKKVPCYRVLGISNNEGSDSKGKWYVQRVLGIFEQDCYFY